MGIRYTKKNLGDPNWSKPNNYKIKQNDAIYDVEIVPNKGVKGDISAQPFNDKNAEDIENALVSLDDDLAFVEADYINNAEHALKQNITDNGLNTTNKTVVGAINEVKSEGEYHDLLQDDAIAIVNNKINALPMNGSLKNIRTSLVGIPTTFTNIDMFNTKQTVTNYQPLSLDYKGAAEPHIILMKTIGDYTFDFAVEATHTNGTDTTIILEAWVDGILYDTATRTLVGGSNQINGITGFFTYSKGTDTVPSEIYFKFRASQGNTSANKALINTNLLGNSSENSFTDTDHVTGISLNEPTYNGATTSFIINDLDARDEAKMPKSGGTFTGGINFGVAVATTPDDLSQHIMLHTAGYGFGVTTNTLNYVTGDNHDFLSIGGSLLGRLKSTVDEPKSLITKDYADLNYLNITAKAADSDKLDGIDSGSFLRSDAADTMTGKLTLTGGLAIDNADFKILNVSAPLTTTDHEVLVQDDSTGQVYRETQANMNVGYATNSGALDGLDSTEFLKLGESEVLYSHAGQTNASFTLSDSIFNFDLISCGVANSSNGTIDGMNFQQVLGSGGFTFQQITFNASGHSLLATAFSIDSTGKNVSAIQTYSRNYNITSTGFSGWDGWFLRQITGMRRIYPLGTVHEVTNIDGVFYRVATTPEGTQYFNTMPQQPELQNTNKVSDNMQDTNEVATHD